MNLSTKLPSNRAKSLNTAVLSSDNSVEGVPSEPSLGAEAGHIEPLALLFL